MVARRDAWLLAIAALLSLVGVLAGFDLVLALGAEPCSAAQAGADCYPWGSEGPAAGSWRYASKASYFASGVILLVLPLLALILSSLRLRKAGRLSAGERGAMAVALAATAAMTFL
jgi:hypothetical protein